MKHLKSLLIISSLPALIGVCFYYDFKDQRYLENGKGTQITIYERSGPNAKILTYKYEVNEVYYKASTSISPITDIKWVGKSFPVTYAIAEPDIHSVNFGDLSRYVSKPVCRCTRTASILDTETLHEK